MSDEFPTYQFSERTYRDPRRLAHDRGGPERRTLQH
jgi:hypothetical protein